MTAVLLLALGAVSFCVPAAPRAEVNGGNVADLVDSLFGTVSSRQSFARQAAAETEAAARFAPSRGKELTYGEFDLPFFFSLLADAAPSAGESFLDVGSGCGRLVLAAALAHSWETAAGVELLEHLHTSAQEAHTRLRAVLEGEPSVSLSPCRLVCAEADEALPSLLRSTCAPHVVFVFATCWPGAGPYLPNLSATLAANLRVGSRVITVDKQLVDEPSRWRFELVSQREAPNYATCSSVGYVYRLAWVADTRDGHLADADDDASLGDGVASTGARHAGMVMSAAPNGDDDAPPPRPPASGEQSLSLSAQMRALAEAAEAQAEAAEALGDGWDEIESMERELAEELGVSVDELEAYLDDGLDVDLVPGEDFDPGRADGEPPSSLPYDIL